jgi:hypothetical protein
MPATTQQQSGWAHIRFIGTDGRPLAHALDPTLLGPVLRGVLIAPSADETVYVVPAPIVESVARLVSGRGFSVVAAEAAATVPTATTPAPQPAARRILRTRPATITPPAPVVAPVPDNAVQTSATGRIRFRRGVENPNDVAVDPRLTPAQQQEQLRTFRVRQQADRMAANQAAVDARVNVPAAPIDVTIRADVVGKMVEVLKTRSSSVLDRLRAEVRQISASYQSEASQLMGSVGTFHAQRFMSSEIQRVSDAMNAEETKRVRMEKFTALSAAFGVPAESLERNFREKVTIVLNTFTAPSNSNLQAVEAKCQRVAALSAELDVKQHLLSGGETAQMAQLEKETSTHLDTISNLPFITGITLRDTRLILSTQDVIISHAGKKWNLGRYEIIVQLIPGDNTLPVTFKSLDLHAGDYHGPHIMGGGSTICWGGIREGMTKLCAEWNWSMLANVAWMFLHSYTHHDNYIQLQSLFDSCHPRRTAA